MSGLALVFLTLLAADPATSRDHLQRAAELVQTGHVEEALPHYTQAIKLRLDNPDAWMGRGKALAMLGRYRDAIDDFDQVVRLQPGSADPLIERGFAYGEAGAFSMAVDDLTRSLRIEPSNSQSPGAARRSVRQARRHGQSDRGFQPRAGDVAE